MIFSSPAAIVFPPTRCSPSPLVEGARALLLAGALACSCAEPAFAGPLSTPGFSGSLSPNASPASFDAGPLGQVFVSGQVSGLGVLQSHATHAGGLGTHDNFVDLSNAQAEIQTTSGPLQFYVQAGAYSIPSLGTSYLRATKTTDQLYGPVPVAYAKVAITPELSVIGGLLPTLIGPESTFTFQNVNVERGLLWNQENAINRGVQVNYGHGPLTASASLNDGYFSGRLNWVSGSLTYALDKANSLTFASVDLPLVDKLPPLLQNNSAIVDLIYTYSAGPITLTPYVQYSHVSRHERVGIDRAASTYSGALLAKYALDKHWSLGGRGEYLKTTGGGCGADPACVPASLAYGAGSTAWSMTLTPTFQQGIFFARAELSYTRIGNIDAGYGFGRNLDRHDQTRGLIEAGLLF